MGVSSSHLANVRDTGWGWEWLLCSSMLVSIWSLHTVSLHFLAPAHLEMLWMTTCHFLNEASYRSSPGLASTASQPLKRVFPCDTLSTDPSDPIWDVPDTQDRATAACSQHPAFTRFYTHCSTLCTLVGLSPPNYMSCEGGDSVYISAVFWAPSTMSAGSRQIMKS